MGKNKREALGSMLNKSISIFLMEGMNQELLSSLERRIMSLTLRTTSQI